MDVIEFLGIDSSRLNADLLVEKFEEEPDIFKILWDVTLLDTYPLSMRSSRVIWLIAKKHPDFIQTYLPEMIAKLDTFKTDGVRRNFMTILVEVPLPCIDLGYLFELCYTWLESPKEPVSIRGNAITILHKISGREPELKPELIDLFEAQLPSESAGIEARIKNFLKKLYNEVK